MTRHGKRGELTGPRCCLDGFVSSELGMVKASSFSVVPFFGSFENPKWETTYLLFPLTQQTDCLL